MTTVPTVTLVGAGPGDPELLTIKAVKALRRATVALVDDLVHSGVLRHLRRSARIVHVGKRGGCLSTPQAFIHRLMVAEAQRGETVVRVKGGDPFVFGRGGEECDALRAAGLQVEVIGGLTAGIAGPAAIGVPVTDRRHARGVALVTGHSGTPEGDPDWAALARCGLTLVIYMGVLRLPAIVAALIAAGMNADTPAAIVSRAHTPEQRQAMGRLGTLVQAVAVQCLESPAIVVIGDVVMAAPMWADHLDGKVETAAADAG
jgi:uroporphyrin-III C-methyltransferase